MSRLQNNLTSALLKKTKQEKVYFVLIVYLWCSGDDYDICILATVTDVANANASKTVLTLAYISLYMYLHNRPVCKKLFCSLGNMFVLTVCKGKMR